MVQVAGSGNFAGWQPLHLPSLTKNEF